MVAFNFTTMDGSIQIEWNDGMFVLRITDLDGSTASISMEADDMADFIEVAGRFCAKYVEVPDYGDY